MMGAPWRLSFCIMCLVCMFSKQVLCLQSSAHEDVRLVDLEEVLAEQRIFLASREGIEKGSKCAALSEIPESAKRRLNAAEMNILSSICWRKDLLNGVNVGENFVLPMLGSDGSHRRGIPPGVSCNVTTWWEHLHYWISRSSQLDCFHSSLLNQIPYNVHLRDK